MTDKPIYNLKDAAEFLKCNVEKVILLGEMEKLPIYVFADNWHAHLWVRNAIEIFSGDDDDEGESEYIMDEPRLASPPNAPCVLNGPVQLMVETIRKFAILDQVATNAFAANDTESGQYPFVGDCEYRLCKSNNPSQPERVKLSVNELFVKFKDLENLGMQLISEKPLSKSERNSLYKLIIGMAISGYKYDPNKNKNSATTDIAVDLQKLGLQLDVDTVRKWLVEASKVLPTTAT